MNTKSFPLIAFLFVLGCTESNKSGDTGSDESADKAPLFSLLSSKETGIDFINELHEDPMSDKNILSFGHLFNGAGVAIGDINNDGLKDVFFSGNDVPNKLYLNKGSLKFEDISDKAGINVNKVWSSGVTMADVNNDGWLDIYVCQFGPNKPENRQNLMYINNGDLTFTEKAKEMGINDSNESSHAAFFDYDNDGDLDLYVLNESKYIMMVYQTVFEDLKNKKNLEAASGNMFRNDGGKFTRVTEEAGMLRYGFGLGLAVSDINEDGWLDVYVANDYSVPDFMYINNGDGTFTDEIKERTKQITFFGMGCDIADINNDGHVDIGVVDMATSDHFRGKTLMESMDVEGFWYFVNDLKYQYQYMFNSLQLNNGTGKFNNIAHMAGVGQTEWSWASLFADFDNDGWKDYFISNGYRRYARDNDFRIEMDRVRKLNGGTVPMEMREEMYAKMPEVKLPNEIYKNDRQLRFQDMTKAWGMDQPSYSNGAAYGDLDNDGDLEMIVSNIDHEAFVYKNNAIEQQRGNFLDVDLKGAAPAVLLGAKVTIHTGSEIQFQEMLPVRGYLSCMDERLHFGLGDKTSVDKVEVIWKDGTKQEISNPAINKTLVVNKDPNAVAFVKNETAAPTPFTSVSLQSLGLNFVHKENTFNDFQAQVLLPHKQSAHGPKISVADVDGDGLDDFYICGAAGQSGELFFQNQDGIFSASPSKPWANEAASEDADAVFFDADGDGDQDLYVVSGGYEIKNGSPLLNDRLYINFGKRNFHRVGLPEAPYHGETAVAGDFDQDGDLDLFIGAACEHLKYPYPSVSYILRNDNKKFTDVTATVAPFIKNIGMVKDAKWTDLDGDKYPELILAGEWMPVTILKNNKGVFEDASEKYGTAKLTGWWYSLEELDVDGDGDKDFIVGNVGMNNKFHPSEKKPFRVFAKDFDQSGTCDPVLSKEYKGKLVPSRGRQCSSQQMPFIKEKFPSYKDFANASMEDIFGEKSLEASLHREVVTFESIVLINNGNGTFEHKMLPIQAQLAPIMSIISKDLNDDGKVDLIIAGNMFDAEVETPRYDAGDGLILFGDGTGNFKPLTIRQSGFYAPHNVKSIAYLRRKGQKGDLILVGNNNREMQAFSFKNMSEIGMK